MKKLRVGTHKSINIPNITTPPMNILKRNIKTPLLLKGEKKSDYYDNQLIKADTGLHGQIFDIIQNRFHDRDINILDIACGDGALSSRLSDHGYLNINAVDIESKLPIMEKGIKFSKLDLNNQNEFEEFAHSNKEKYELILGIETIEHLENPWNYLRSLKIMLKKSGIILISTPNISSIYSKISFLTKNIFFQFGEDDLSYWHINPISSFEMVTIINHLNLKLIEKTTGGTYPILWLKRNIHFSIVYSLGNLIFYPICREDRYGWCIIYTITK